MTDANSYMQVAHQAIEVLKPIVSEVSLGLGTHALWDWMKRRLHDKGAAALEAVAQTPEDEEEWEVLELRLQQTLKSNPSLIEELASLLPGSQSSTQNMINVGDSNTNVQSSGTANQVNVNQGPGK